MTAEPRHRVVLGDAFDVLPGLDPMPHVFTSLPDAAEVDMAGDEWARFFYRCAYLVIKHLDPTGYAIFYQTDRRRDGHLYDKAAMVAAAARGLGARIVWHKIAVHTMGVSLFRPGYSHLVAVSHRGTAGRPTPDVFKAGRKIYPDATDAASLDVGLDFLVGKGAVGVVDPFAGRGSIAAAAARRGLWSISVDIDPDMFDAAHATIAEAIS